MNANLETNSFERNCHFIRKLSSVSFQSTSNTSENAEYFEATFLEKRPNHPILDGFKQNKTNKKTSEWVESSIQYVIYDQLSIDWLTMINKKKKCRCHRNQYGYAKYNNGKETSIISIVIIVYFHPIRKFLLFVVQQKIHSYCDILRSITNSIE